MKNKKSSNESKGEFIEICQKCMYQKNKPSRCSKFNIYVPRKAKCISNEFKVRCSK